MRIPSFLYHTTPKKNLEDITVQGLRAQKPVEWRGLIPTRYRNDKIVWLLGNKTRKTNIRIDTSLLNEKNLHKLNLRDKRINWWFYVGNIPATAIDTANK